MADPVEHGITANQANSLRHGPDERGHFGGWYGGRFVAETLMPLVLELEQAYNAAKADPSSRKNLISTCGIMWGGPARFGSPAA